MLRYKVTAFYQEKATENHVAQNLVIIAPDDKEAIRKAKSAIAPGAIDGRITAIKVVEKAPIEPGVVYRGEPYIPFRWPVRQSQKKAPDQPTA